MKKYLLVATAMIFSIYMFGCGKKQQAMEEQPPMSMEALSTMPTPAQPVPETKAAMALPQPVPGAKLEPLPPSGPYKPSATEIQTALKNAGFYTGEVDGKIGHKTKKAVEEFQKANGLQADGKVGSKTWAALSKYLNAPAAAVTPSKR